jgi:hypothetical protein
MHACMYAFPAFSLRRRRDVDHRWTGHGNQNVDFMLVGDDDYVALTITVLICFVFLIRYSIHILTKRKTNDWGLATTEQVVG